MYREAELFFLQRKILRYLTTKSKILIILHGSTKGCVILVHGSKILLKRRPLSAKSWRLTKQCRHNPIKYLYSLVGLMYAIFIRNFPFELQLHVNLEHAIWINTDISTSQPILSGNVCFISKITESPCNTVTPSRDGTEQKAAKGKDQDGAGTTVLQSWG